MAGDEGTRPLPHRAPEVGSPRSRGGARPRGPAAAGGRRLPGGCPWSSLRGAAETLKGFPVDAEGRPLPPGLGGTLPRQDCSQKGDRDCRPP